MGKHNDKSLTYDKTLPPFLQRLHAQESSGRSTFQAPRNKKNKSAEEEAEDEPVYFDEETGDSLTKGEWEAKEAFEPSTESLEKPAGGNGEVVEKEGGEKVEEEKKTVIGGSKKRKVGKVVGVEDAEEEESGGTGKKVGDGGNGEGVGVKKAKGKAGGENGKEKGKGGKKGGAKKVKLSFGDEE